jgi:hypothetical protein
MPNVQVACLTLAGSQTRVTPNRSYDWLGGPQGEGIISQLHGRFYQQTYNRQLWAASLTTAAAIPINTTTNGVTFAIWNPAGNPYSIVPVAFILGYVATSGAAGSFGYYYVSGTGSDIGASPAKVQVFTALTMQSQILGSSYAGNAKAGSAVTLSAAGTLARWSQFSQATPGTNNTQGPYSLIEWFDGTMVIPPGVLWYPAANVASTDTFMQTLICYESPWP